MRLIGTVVAAVLGMACTKLAWGATASETFDSASSANSNGWFSSGDGTNGQIAGFSNSNLAGGIAGEGRAQLTRGVPDRDGYRDFTLNGLAAGTFTANNAFSYSGKLEITSSNADVEMVNLGVLIDRRQSRGRYRAIKDRQWLYMERDHEFANRRRWRTDRCAGRR